MVISMSGKSVDKKGTCGTRTHDLFFLNNEFNALAARPKYLLVCLSQPQQFTSNSLITLTYNIVLIFNYCIHTFY